jgi:hypothetical protein
VSLSATLQKTAIKALKTYGARATLTHVTVGAFDPATGTTSGSSALTACSAFLDSASLKTLGFKFNPDLIQGGDIMATVAGVLPVAGDILTVLDGPFAWPYVVIEARPQIAGADAVMTQCLVRK